MLGMLYLVFHQTVRQVNFSNVADRIARLGFRRVATVEVTFPLPASIRFIVYITLPRRSRAVQHFYKSPCAGTVTVNDVQ